MSYVVLARKWRPMRFEDLIGQDHVARTLANAIDSGRVAHAFLFTGVRGVGKTTSARILAKALNCMRPPGTIPEGTDPGPTATPCLECAACEEIAKGTDVDVREIDGASYNGVDEVRKLQDSLPYRPTRDRYKIIIVDEVHMLSQSAWNAFLKTLEEPPPHVKFIFATTEVHKVPITILSRIQRFDFKLISATQIAARLRWVLEQEKIQADDEALSIIARQAAGSMRDAMSLLDQVIAWGGQTLVGKDVALVLGVASRTALIDITRALLGGDAPTCLGVVAHLVEEGYDIVHAAKDLLATLRDLVVCRVCPDPKALLDLSEEEAKDIQALAEGRDPDDLVRLHQGFSDGFDDVMRGGQPRAALEMLLVRLCRRPPLLPVDDLIHRLGQLEQRLLGKRGPEARPPAGGPAPGTSNRPRARETRTVGARAATSSEGSDDPPAAPAQSLEPPAPAPRSVPEPSSKVAPPLPPAPARHAAPSHPAPAAAPTTPSAPSETSADDARPKNGAGGPSNSGDSEAPGVLALARFRDVVEVIREQRPELAAFLEHAAVLHIEPGSLMLAYPPKSMFAEQVKGKECVEAVATAAGSVLGAPTRVEFKFDYEPAGAMDTLSADRVRAREARVRKAIADAKNHPRVTDAIQLFGARLKDLKLSEGT